MVEPTQLACMYSATPLCLLAVTDLTSPKIARYRALASSIAPQHINNYLGSRGTIDLEEDFSSPHPVQTSRVAFTDHNTDQKATYDAVPIHLMASSLLGLQPNSTWKRPQQ